MTKSYFEIGGHIVELEHGTSTPSSSPSPSLFRGAPTVLAEGATPRNKQEAGGRKGDHGSSRTPPPQLPYTPYSYGSPLVWLGAQVFYGIVDPGGIYTGDPREPVAEAY